MTMATKPDPWQPIGTIIYWIVLFFVEKTGFKLHEGGPLAGGYDEDREPSWLYCGNCNEHTVHEPHYWTLEGDTDHECTECGAVRLGDDHVPAEVFRAYARTSGQVSCGGGHEEWWLPASGCPWCKAVV